MKKTIFNILVLVLATSCKESFIELNPITSASTSTFYKTSGDFVNAINATYAVLQANGMYRNHFMFGDIPTDDSFANLGSCISGACDFDNFTVTPSTSVSGNVLASRWSDAYRGIYRSNSLLARIDAVEFDAALKKRIKGEALFLRALFYFTLAQTFGDVPLIVNELKTVEESYAFGREPVSKVYAQIEQDLKEAASLLPAKHPSNADAGRATSGAAKGLLGRVLLFQNKHAEALPVLKEVIDSKVYSLLPNYADVFKENNGNNAEILFAVQYSRGGVGEGNSITPTFAPLASGNAVIVGGGNGFNQPTTDIEKAYEPNDERKNATIATSYTAVNGQKVDYYFVKKYLDPAMISPNETGVDYPVLRYSDILLMYAEALNETGKTGEAHTYLNDVRKRAKLAPKENLSQSAMRLAIEQERRVELSFEGLRFFDLVRTNRLLPVMNKYFQENNLQVQNQLIQVQEHQKVFPIPQAQIDINPTIISQNLGY